VASTFAARPPKPASHHLQQLGPDLVRRQADKSGSTGHDVGDERRVVEHLRLRQSPRRAMVSGRLA
jgi:hypothetical protein